MSDLPDRVRRAFADHDGFEGVAPDRYAATRSPFEAVVRVVTADEGRIGYAVTVEVPMLGAVADDVAPVVEEGWFETFERRIEDVGDITRGASDLDPTVEREGSRGVVTASFEDIDERRGVEDALAFVNYVEGTYVQGIIPGYEYDEPVAGLISRARAAAGSDPGE